MKTESKKQFTASRSNIVISCPRESDLQTTRQDGHFVCIPVVRLGCAVLRLWVIFPRLPLPVKLSTKFALIAVIACDKAGHMFHIFSAYPSWLDIVLSWCTA